MTMMVVSGAISSLSMMDVFVDPFLRDVHESERDRNIRGVVGIAAALAGQSGSAATAARSVEVPAVFVGLGINGATLHGVLDSRVSDFPFQEGDQVVVMIEGVGSEVADGHIKAIARPSDRIVVMQPHCTAGRRHYFRRARRRWSIVSVIGAVLASWLYMTTEAPTLAQAIAMGCGALAVSLLYAGFEYRVYVENYRPFVQLAERVFGALGLKDVEHVDLARYSKKTQTDKDPPGYRFTCFRY